VALTVGHLQDILEPGAQALGLEIVAVELSGNESSILRVYIDQPSGVTVEDCAKASRQFGAILDVADPISSRYTLEVSSPGMDRPLAKPEHFKQVIGERVKIKMTVLVEGRRRFTGELVDADELTATVNVDGVESTLAFADMDRARLVPVFD
jgi:ribosome maturation factor RimP